MKNLNMLQSEIEKMINVKLNEVAELQATLATLKKHFSSEKIESVIEKELEAVVEPVVVPAKKELLKIEDVKLVTEPIKKPAVKHVAPIIKCVDEPVVVPKPKKTASKQKPFALYMLKLLHFVERIESQYILTEKLKTDEQRLDAQIALIKKLYLIADVKEDYAMSNVHREINKVIHSKVIA